MSIDLSGSRPAGTFSMIREATSGDLTVNHVC